IARFEKQLCQTADLVLAVSQEDAAILQTMSNGKPLHIVPNGIFTEQYTETTSSVTLGEYAIVFTGKMDYRPNVDAMLWFTEEILPLIRNKVPQATLTIVGQKPHPRLSALQKQKHITITGWVESVKPYLKAAKVYVAPLRMGSGTRLKILEAMASECAVVATSTAAAGLNAELKSALVLADRAQDVAQSTVRLLQNPEHRQTLGRNAQIAVRKHYDWSALIPRLIAAYKDIGLE
ncbi:MAG: glycosyl transferase family 1, partial [Phototrophicales bacterium]